MTGTPRAPVLDGPSSRISETRMPSPSFEAFALHWDISSVLGGTRDGYSCCPSTSNRTLYMKTRQSNMAPHACALVAAAHEYYAGMHLCWYAGTRMSTLVRWHASIQASHQVAHNKPRHSGPGPSMHAPLLQRPRAPSSAALLNRSEPRDTHARVQVDSQALYPTHVTITLRGNQSARPPRPSSRPARSITSPGAWPGSAFTKKPRRCAAAS